jgi:uncharacterized membrane protein
MSAGRIILLIFGIIGILISIGLLVGGGAILWLDYTAKDSDGFYTTKTIQIEKDSFAVVTGSANIDIEADWGWGWQWDLGNLATFKVEGSSNDPSNQLFIGIARESDLNAYLSGVEHDEIVRLHIYPDSIDYQHHSGSVVPRAPTLQTFWTSSAFGAETQSFEWELEPGSHSLVLMNSDGSAGIDIDIELGVKVPWLLGVGIGLLAGGVIALVTGSVMVIFAVRRPKTIPPKPPETPALAEDESTGSQEGANTMSEIKDKTSTGLKPNTAALLSYLFGWVTGIIFFILEKDNKYVRFHALQSIIVFGVLSVAGSILGWIPFFGWVAGAFIGILTFILWLVLMIKAYQGEKYKIPWAGDFAEKQVS